MKPKNIGHMNFYECCDLTEKSISNIYIYNYTDGAGFWLQFFFLQKSIKMSLKVDILLKIELATDIGTTKYLGVVLRIWANCCTYILYFGFSGRGPNRIS